MVGRLVKHSYRCMAQKQLGRTFTSLALIALAKELYSDSNFGKFRNHHSQLPTSSGSLREKSLC